VYCLYRESPTTRGAFLKRESVEKRTRRRYFLPFTAGWKERIEAAAKEGKTKEKDGSKKGGRKR